MILSRHKGDLPQEGASRAISGGPLYQDVLDLLESCDTRAWTRKCIRDLQSLSMDGNDLKRMIAQAVRTGVFRGSEWCQNGSPDVWAACDAYSFSQTTWNDAAQKDITCNYYIKFFVNELGTVVLTVSFHLSG